MDFTSALSQLARLEYGALQVVVVIVIVAIAHLFPKACETWVWARGAPFFPVLLCSLGSAFVPGIHPADANYSIGVKLMIGCVLGATASWAYKAVRQTFLGHDDRIRMRTVFQNTTSSLPPPAVPAPPTEPPPANVTGEIERKIDLPDIRTIGGQRSWAIVFGGFLIGIAAVLLTWHVLRIAGCVGSPPAVVVEHPEDSNR